MNFFPDGGRLSTPLIQATDGILYGTASEGGAYFDGGTIFQITLDGTFRVMHAFAETVDGLGPTTPLLQGKDGNFYGMTAGGGFYLAGTIFQMTPDGTLTVLHTFARPGFPMQSGLIEDTDGNLYGTTQSLAFGGIAFQRAPDGTFTTLHLFDGGLNGFVPSALIQATDGNLYGTTWLMPAHGMVFRLVITP
jgi:uncharacterized repeat protein (TIGR03803 family)